MTSVQGGKILADVRTDSFHSGPLRPGTQHTSTPLTDNQHNMFRWQQPHRVKVSDDLNQRGLSWKVNRAGLRVYRRLKSHRHRTLRTDIHTNRSWAEVVKFCTSEKTATCQQSRRHFQQLKWTQLLCVVLLSLSVMVRSRIFSRAIVVELDSEGSIASTFTRNVEL